MDDWKCLVEADMSVVSASLDGWNKIKHTAKENTSLTVQYVPEFFRHPFH